MALNAACVFNCLGFLPVALNHEKWGALKQWAARNATHEINCLGLFANRYTRLDFAI